MGKHLQNCVKIAMTKIKIISVILLFKYLLKFVHQTYLWKVKNKYFENYLMS